MVRGGRIAFPTVRQVKLGQAGIVTKRATRSREERPRHRTTSYDALITK
jgi:hypothetical protein